MLREVKSLIGFTMGATDGEIGHVRDFYFDDEAWVIRYLVVETGTWLMHRKVLVSPIALGAPDWAADSLPAKLTREQLRNCPSIDTDQPVSRQHELAFSGYYGYPNYWGGSGLWGAGYYPGAMLTGVGYEGSGSEYLAAEVEQERRARAAEQRKPADPHLRSCKAVTGYHIDAVDGELGHIEGMLIDERSWAIRYLIVNTSNWWLGHRVLIAPEWITDVSWLERKVAVDLTRQAIQESPPYDPALLPDRPGESLIYEHYGRDGYWREESLSPIKGPSESTSTRPHS